MLKSVLTRPTGTSRNPMRPATTIAIAALLLMIVGALVVQLIGAR
jgi:hypothetical protein